MARRTRSTTSWFAAPRPMDGDHGLVVVWRAKLPGQVPHPGSRAPYPAISDRSPRKKLPVPSARITSLDRACHRPCVDGGRASRSGSLLARIDHGSGVQGSARGADAWLPDLLMVPVPMASERNG